MSAYNTLLIVEDDDAIRETMKLALELRGYTAFEASNGKEGLEQLARMPRPCLILLDLMMPVMDGRGFVEALAKGPRHDVPVVVVTAFGDRVEGIHVDGVIPKPCALDLLYRTVQQHCGSPECQPGLR